jgi:hypothetical protein
LWLGCFNYFFLELMKIIRFNVSRRKGGTIP